MDNVAGMKICPRCQGSTWVDGKDCPVCEATGALDNQGNPVDYEEASWFVRWYFEQHPPRRWK